jgi:hypothetical protein
MRKETKPGCPGQKALSLIDFGVLFIIV